jgi:ferredoxin
MRIPTVDLSRCTLCMSCVEVCPAVFHLNHAGYIEVLPRDDYPMGCVEEAIKYCPEDVIEWTED